VPVYSSCYLTTVRPHDRHAKLDPHRWQRHIILDAINHIIHHHHGDDDTNSNDSDKSQAQVAAAWHRYHGANHVFTFSHDFGGCLSWRDDGMVFVTHTRLAAAFIVSLVIDLMTD
jgi:hypothetical protein